MNLHPCTTYVAMEVNCAEFTFASKCINANRFSASENIHGDCIYNSVAIVILMGFLPQRDNVFQVLFRLYDGNAWWRNQIIKSQVRVSQPPPILDNWKYFVIVPACLSVGKGDNETWSPDKKNRWNFEIAETSLISIIRQWQNDCQKLQLIAHLVRLLNFRLCYFWWKTAPEGQNGGSKAIKYLHI